MKKLQICIVAAAAIMAAASCKEDTRNNLILKGPEQVTKSVTAPAPAAGTQHHVIYEANPRCFAASGQINAIKNRLTHIKALGTDIIWIMPVYPLGAKNAFGSPYCIKDFKDVRSECGSVEGLANFVVLAHSLGMKVILDWVANHTAWDHPWVTEHPDWYTKDGQGNIVYPETWTDVADLNYASQDLRTAMMFAMKFWADKGVDGFRCDYAHGIPDDFWSWVIPLLKEINPDFVMLAESDYERLYDDGFDIIFSRALKAGLVDLFAGRIKPAAFMAESYQKTMANVPAGKSKLFFITNHDDASEISPVKQFPGENAALAAFALAASLDGTTLIYSSQEVGYDSKLNFCTTTLIDWTSNSSYTEKYNTLMSSLSGLDRSKGFSSYVSDSAVWIVYENGYVVVNTTADKVRVQYPSGISEGDEPLSLGAYEYKVVVK